MIQGEIISNAVAALPETSRGGSAGLLSRLSPPTQTRARVYDDRGTLMFDTDVAPALSNQEPAGPQGFIDLAYAKFQAWFGYGDLPVYVEYGAAEGKRYPEVALALTGQEATFVRVDDRGSVVVSVAIPIRFAGAAHAALMLSTRGADIDEMVVSERVAITKVFVIAAFVMIALSFLLAGGIAGPVRRLASAAKRVRQRTRSRVEIPDFTARRDEIGDLSGALRDMTDWLYSRIEAIERFAADVAHELKNPLTSLRSAVETLPLAKTAKNRARLLEVIQHDVQRLDRLISDISDASRLDAELQRHDVHPVDMGKLLKTIVGLSNEVPRQDGVTVKIDVVPASRSLVVSGHDSRLGQVVNNLIDNAISFSPANGTVRTA
jgi:two-component system sensor histidine kinase ChvG